MVTFEVLSRNLAIIINELVTSQELCKLLVFNDKDPFNNNNLADTSKLVGNLIKPFPFDITEGGEARSELRAYFPHGKLQGNQVIGDIKVHFDIVVAKTLWTISGDDWSGIRPYEIAHYTTNCFQKKSFDGFGKLRFDDGFVHLGANAQFDIIRLIATMTVSK